MVDAYMLHKEIFGIAKFDDTKILNDTDKKLPVDIILQNAVISMTCFIKNDNKFFLQIYLEEALLVA